jgi:hypothetical protein
MTDVTDPKKPEPDRPLQREPEFTGPGWKNPYVLYILLTLALFGFLVLMGYIAWNNDWIPKRT